MAWQLPLILAAVLAYALHAESSVSDADGPMLVQTRALLLGQNDHGHDHMDAQSSVPDVIVIGHGDSGTRGVIAALHRLGLRMCNYTNPQLDNTNTYGNQKFAVDFLKSSGGVVSEEKGTRRADAQFREAVRIEREGSDMTKKCADEGALNNASSSWGYKNPNKIYTMPVLDEAFHKKHHVLIVARDPRDICTGPNQMPFDTYGELVLGRKVTNQTRTRDCFEWWASTWRDVLRQYADDDHVQIVRIEDLVVRDPSSPEAQRALDCAANHARLTIDHDSRNRELNMFHQYESTYMGGHIKETSYSIQDVEQMLVTYESLVQDVMLLLGYDTKAYGLVNPTSRQVCI